MRTAVALLLMALPVSAFAAPANEHIQTFFTAVQNGSVSMPTAVQLAASEARVRSDLPRDSDGSGNDEGCCGSTVLALVPLALDCIAVIVSQQDANQ